MKIQLKVTKYIPLYFIYFYFIVFWWAGLDSLQATFGSQAFYLTPLCY